MIKQFLAANFARDFEVLLTFTFPASNGRRYGQSILFRAKRRKMLTRHQMLLGSVTTAELPHDEELYNTGLANFTLPQVYVLS
jgi:hypothetical protein